MAKYKIVSYSKYSRLHTLRGVDNNSYMPHVDLFVDASFPDMDGKFNDGMELSEAIEVEKSLVGKIVEIDNFTPLSFAACNVKISTNK